MKRFLPALLLVVLILATGPAIRVIQTFLFTQFPSSTKRILAAIFVLVFLGLLGYALWQIRERRFLRYAGLATSAALVVAMAVSFRRGMVEVDLVERIHILEYGLLAFLLYWALLPRRGVGLVALPLLGVMIAGTLDEGWQWFVAQRTGEIRDVGLNVAAGVAGLLFSLSLLPPERLVWRGTRREWERIARMAAVAVLLLGIFFAVAHLGYEIHDPEIGRFRSWFTVEKLSELEAEHAVEWATDPPVKIGYYEPEDYYLTEASWHANHRNASHQHGDDYLAWQANLILEKYYAPFLDVVGYRGAGAHRWPPELRREIEAKAGRHDPKGYDSPVFRDRIYVEPSKPVFFLGLGVVAVGLWLLPVIPRFWRSRS